MEGVQADGATQGALAGVGGEGRNSLQGDGSWQQLGIPLHSLCTFVARAIGVMRIRSPPHPPFAALVERYIDAHAGSHTIWELEGASGQEVRGRAQHLAHRSTMPAALAPPRWAALTSRPPCCAPPLSLPLPPCLVAGMAGERSCAAFLLQLGLRSIAAGNTGGRLRVWQQDAA